MVTEVPLPVRAGWLRALYPQVRVVEAWDGPQQVGDAPEIRRQHEAYILETLGITGITHFYSSEFYGAHISAALGAVDWRVDEACLQLPISGTAIRVDLYGCRHFLDPLVYRDLISNVLYVVFLVLATSGLLRWLQAGRETSHKLPAVGQGVVK